jgi:outer membrane protein assembly factor BamB
MNMNRSTLLLTSQCLVATGLLAYVATTSAYGKGKPIPPAPTPPGFGDLLFRLSATDPASRWFGESVSISGQTVLVGAPDLSSTTRSGSAYLFDVTTGQPLRTLTASDALPGVGLGSDVAILGNTALVGGYLANKAYLFDVTTGEELLTFMTSDSVPGDRFGSSVALSGNKAVGIASGPSHYASAAYVFDVSSGQELQNYTPSDSVLGDRFGISGFQGSIAVGGNIGIGGDRYKDNGGLTDSGAAYLFDVTTGEELFKLQPSDPREGNLFGQDVAISGNKALVGATHSVIGTDTSGAAYLFDVTTGQQLFKFAAPGKFSVGFGWSVALNSTTALVGARNENAAYLFDLETGQLLKRLTGPTRSSRQFGASVAMNDNFAVIGARSENDQGAAYVFDISRAIAAAEGFDAITSSAIPEPIIAALLAFGVLPLVTARRRA